MEFVNNLKQAKEKILQLFPEFRNFDEINIGWQNYIVQADNKIIFRFPRNSGALESLHIEVDLLDVISKSLPRNIQVPHYIHCDYGDRPFGCYNIVAGKTFSYNEFIKLSHKEKVDYLKKVRSFLEILNSIEPPAGIIKPFDSYNYYNKLYSEIINKCYYLFDNKLRRDTDILFKTYLEENNNNYTPLIVHGDLKLNHILINENNIGIIDFGDLKLFDSMYDYTWIYGIDRTLLSDFKFNKDEINRVKFYSQVVPYYQILHGVKNNNGEKIRSGFKMIYK